MKLFNKPAPTISITLAAVVALCLPRPGQSEPQLQTGPAHNAAVQEMDCSACHTTESWKIIQINGQKFDREKFDHARTGFPLTGKHRKLQCAACHRGEIRPSRACRSCHETAHGGTFYRNCETCHTTLGTSRAKAIEAHYKTRLPLTGKHALLDCTQCHRQTEGLQWRNVPSDCFSCHKTEYFSAGTHPPHSGTATSAPFPRNCAQCHRTTGWSPALLPKEEVLRATRSQPLKRAPRNHELKFPIKQGAHRGLACNSCHISTANPRMVRCIGCHAHTPSRLATQHQNVKVPVAKLPCIRCHAGGARR